MDAKNQSTIHIFLLLILTIAFAFSNRTEAESLKRENPGSASNAANVPQTVKTNNESGKYADQLRALLEKLAELYQELQTYIEQYKVIKNELRDAKEAYAENPSSQNHARLEALESDMREILARIETLKGEIDDLENNVIPNVERKLSQEASDDSNSRKDELLAIIDRIKSEINQVSGQYPEIDALVNDKPKYKLPVYKQKDRGPRSLKQ